MTTTIEPAAAPVVAYAGGAPSAEPGVARGLLVAGLVHGVACSVYLAQRVARFVGGTEDMLLLSQTWTVATVGLALQSVLALALIATTLAALARPTTARRSGVAIAAALLGLAWFGFGWGEGWRHFTVLPTTPEAWKQYAAYEFGNLAREVNQALLPALLTFAFARRWPADVLVRTVGRVALVSCALLALPPIAAIAAASDVSRQANWANYYRGRLIAAGSFAAAFLLLGLVRRPLHVMAAMPLLAYVARDLYVNNAERIAALRGPPTLEIVWGQARSISYQVVMAGAAVAAFVVLTIGGARPARRVD